MGKDKGVLKFIFFLCLSCGFLLALVAYVLRSPQEEARRFDQNKQMLIAAGVLNHRDEFFIEGAPALFDSSHSLLVPTQEPKKASEVQIEEIGRLRIRPLVTNAQGDVSTLEEQGMDLTTYLSEHKKAGYALLSWKLFYAVLPNTVDAPRWEASKDLTRVTALVFPVSGFGLWAPIYGYLALAPNGNTVVGTTWYEMGETPGLGAGITTAWWQQQFVGKLLFHENAEGKIDPLTADIGLIVVKGRVQDVYGNQPLAHSAVDGLSGATLTGDGVTAAYKKSLTPYRSFLIKLYAEKK